MRHLNSFEIVYPDGRTVVLIALDRRHLERRLSPATLNDAVIREKRPGPAPGEAL